MTQYATQVERPWRDVSAHHIAAGVLTAVLWASREGLHPARLRIPDDTMTYLLMSLPPSATLIEDEAGVAVVLWTVVGRVAVRVDVALKDGKGVLECENPPSEKTLWFAT